MLYSKHWESNKQGHERVDDFGVGRIRSGTVKYYAQIRLQVWQNSVCTGQRNLPLIAQ